MAHHLHMAHQERGLRIVNTILVGCSMSLSAYFGFVLGENVFPLNIVLALLCGSVAFGVSLLFERAGFYNTYGMRSSAVFCWIIGCLFLVSNTIFDYSSAAALRDSVAVKATNANNRAKDVRDQIALVQKNITDAKATVAWQAALLPGPSYEAEIRNLEGNRTIMERSKGCTDQTRPDTKAHCDRLSSAKANLAMAQQKSVYETQVTKWEAELLDLAAKSTQNEGHSNAAVAQVKAFFSWMKGDLNLNDTEIAWGQYALMALMTVLVNAGLAFLGNEIGTQRALAHMAARYEPRHEEEPRPVHRLAYHPRRDDDREPDVGPEPVPLKPAPAARPARETSTETVVVTSTHGLPAMAHEEDPNIKELLRRSQEAAKKAREMLAQMKAEGSA